MIIDLERFVAAREPDWKELDAFLHRAQESGLAGFSLEQAERFNLLYRRTSADLNRVQSYAGDPALGRYLESLVSRGFMQMYQVRRYERRRSLLGSLFFGFPAVVRAHARLLLLSVAVTLAGALFGGLAIALDPGAKPILIGFEHLKQHPGQRVADEEKAEADRYHAGMSSAFSAFLMTHNIKVSLFAVGLGFTFGIGTLVLLFYNGVILGAVCADYIISGYGRFLAGWLLPHGAFEIPAILIAGQAGLLIASCVLKGRHMPRLALLRERGPEILTLIGGLALMLVWAGLVEAFMSQTHEPVLPYSVKIAFGAIELAALTFYLTRVRPRGSRA